MAKIKIERCCYLLVFYFKRSGEAVHRATRQKSCSMTIKKKNIFLIGNISHENAFQVNVFTRQQDTIDLYTCEKERDVAI